MWTALSPAVDNLKLPERGGGEMRTLASSCRSTINKIARIMVTFKLLHPFKGSFCNVSWAIQNFSWRIVYQSKCLHSHWGVKKWGGTIYQNFAHIHSNSSFCTQPNVLSDFSKGEFKHSRVHNRIVPLLASFQSAMWGTSLPFTVGMCFDWWPVLPLLAAISAIQWHGRVNSELQTKTKRRFLKISQSRRRPLLGPLLLVERHW